MDNNQPTSFQPNPQPASSVDGFAAPTTRPMQTAPAPEAPQAPYVPQQAAHPMAAPDMSKLFAPDAPLPNAPVLTMKSPKRGSTMLVTFIVAALFFLLGGGGAYMIQKNRDAATINSLNATNSKLSTDLKAATAEPTAATLQKSITALTTYQTNLTTVANQLKTTCGKGCAAVVIPTPPALNKDGSLNTTTTATTTTSTTTTTTK
jgi:hypothetical protein